MQHASVGVRSAARKGSNTLLHGGHNGPGSTTAQANPTSRSIHTANILHTELHATRSFLPPRSPPHRLFSVSRNLLQRLFTHLTAPGLRLPLAQNLGSRSLHSTALRLQTIESGLSLPVRNSLRKYSLQRQANTFLPRGPASPAPRCGGVAQVGLGVARNFSTARPIFEHIAQNIPIALRALYEMDMDLEIQKGHRFNKLNKVSKDNGQTTRFKSAAHLVTPKYIRGGHKVTSVQRDIPSQSEFENYFAPTPVSVTTYLSIPLAPAPTSRTPLPPDPVFVPTCGDCRPSLLPPLTFLASLHNSHATHALRVETLFARLDQAGVWSLGGVRCYAYSQGLMHRRTDPDEACEEGACTALQIEFKGWSQSDVRSVLGESGVGWCTIEEVYSTATEGLSRDDSDTDSLISSVLDDDSPGMTHRWNHFRDIETLPFDPAESLVLPSIDISSTGSSQWNRTSSTSPASIPPDMEVDPWVDVADDGIDEHSISILSSPFSSCSDLSELIIDPPSLNGWFRVNAVPMPQYSHGIPSSRSSFIDF